jgi:hypothetical protein
MAMQELGIATLNLENGKCIDVLPELVAKLPGLDVLLLRKARVGSAWASSAGSKSRARSRPGAGTAAS